MFHFTFVAAVSLAVTLTLWLSLIVLWFRSDIRPTTQSDAVVVLVTIVVGLLAVFDSRLLGAGLAVSAPVLTYWLGKKAGVQ